MSSNVPVCRKDAASHNLHSDMPNGKGERDRMLTDPVLWALFVILVVIVVFGL